MTDPIRAALERLLSEDAQLAHKAYVAFVQICKGNSDDAGTYDEDERLVRTALACLDDLLKMVRNPANLLAQPAPPAEGEVAALMLDPLDLRRKGPSDEELLEIRDGAYCPGVDEVNDEEDSMWQYTSDYIRWLDEHGSTQEKQEYEAKGLRAVFDAGARFAHPALPLPTEDRT